MQTLPTPSLQHEHGWLSPDGDLLGCPWFGHEDLAESIIEHSRLARGNEYADSRVLERLGWVKLKGGMWIFAAREELTQRQLDAIFDWHVQRDLELPDEMLTNEELSAKIGARPGLRIPSGRR